MRRADVVRMIRPLQLALALTPLVALVLPGAVTHAASRSLGEPFAEPVTQPPYVEHARSSLDNPTGFRCAR